MAYLGINNPLRDENWALFMHSAREDGYPDPSDRDDKTTPNSEQPLSHFVRPLNSSLVAHIDDLTPVTPEILQDLAGKQASLALRRKLIRMVVEGKWAPESALYSWYRISGFYCFAPFSQYLSPDTPKTPEAAACLKIQREKNQKAAVKRVEVVDRICYDIDRCWARLAEDDRQHKLAGGHDSAVERDMQATLFPFGQRILAERRSLHKNIFRRNLVRTVNAGRISRKDAVRCWVDFCLQERLTPFISALGPKSRPENITPRKIKLKRRRP